mgnify:CR=1 FL=1
MRHRVSDAILYPLVLLIAVAIVTSMTKQAVTPVDKPKAKKRLICTCFKTDNGERVRGTNGEWLGSDTCDIHGAGKPQPKESDKSK